MPQLLKLRDGLIGDGSNVLCTGFTSSVGLSMMLSASFLERFPMVNNNVPINSTVPKYDPTMATISYGSSARFRVASAENAGPDSAGGAGPKAMWTSQRPALLPVALHSKTRAV
jgi:hypothetical protein